MAVRISATYLLSTYDRRRCPNAPARTGARGEQNIILNTPLPQWSKEVINNLINQKIPNDETAQAIKDAREGKNMAKVSLDELKKEVGA